MDVPKYRELPLIGETGDYRHAWQVFPPDDDLGCLRHLTPEARRRGLATVTENVVVNISLPLDEPDPPLFGRKRFTHTVFSPSRNSMDDRLDGFFPQGSTQWDGFRHVRAREFGFFTGHQGDFADDRLGIGHWAQAGIIGRGVLLDLSEEDGVIGPGRLARAAADAGVEVLPGDILCVRTGWLERYRRGDAVAGEQRRWPGLAGSSAMAELLWGWQISAVTADNPALEVAPGRPEDGSLHRRLLPLLGLPIGELFTFDRLAQACRELGRFAFLFVSVPLNLPGGVGSPANAVAVL
ncbi:cyclase family protein [Amycolatopsis pithecellobii]|uniref:Cyclase family protein n=1 Tax=Amycolatopsis pithecellobii TaxID=664692 RepID=A0A6N7YMC5_9PSEU|nr:cyclase family protein [Amycolatopsis pithecellobii]MTD53182.1 cyclase family protein [Amycolatopsis pithecellobii]